MYAVTIKEYGNETKLKLELDVTAPQPNANQVMVEVKASSVNPIDLMKRSGLWKGCIRKTKKDIIPMDTRVRFFWKCGLSRFKSY